MLGPYPPDVKHLGNPQLQNAKDRHEPGRLDYQRQPCPAPGDDRARTRSGSTASASSSIAFRGAAAQIEYLRMIGDEIVRPSATLGADPAPTLALHRPDSSEAACELLARLGDDAAPPYAGGTELRLLMNRGGRARDT
jgi:hypothetical protein